MPEVINRQTRADREAGARHEAERIHNGFDKRYNIFSQRVLSSTEDDDIESALEDVCEYVARETDGMLGTDQYYVNWWHDITSKIRYDAPLIAEFHEWESSCKSDGTDILVPEYFQTLRRQIRKAMSRMRDLAQRFIEDAINVKYKDKYKYKMEKQKSMASAMKDIFGRRINEKANKLGEVDSGYRPSIVSTEEEMD